MNKRTLVKRLFLALMGIQALGELSFGIMLLVNLPWTLEAGLGISYRSDLDLLGLALGLYLVLLTSLIVLSMIWVIQENTSGVTIGIIVGVFLIVFGIMAFIQLGDVQAIYRDILRGILTVVLALQVKKSFGAAQV